MSHIIGVFGLLTVSLFTVYCSFRVPEVAKYLFIALILRIIFALVNTYIVPLPDTQFDSNFFERYAWELYEKNIGVNDINFYGNGLGYPLYLSYFYYIFEVRSPLFLQSLSVGAGVAVVFFSYKISTKIWDIKSSKRVALLVAIFPSLVLYSSIIMREMFILLFILISYYYLIDYFSEFKVKINNLFFALVSFTIAGSLHGLALIFLVGFFFTAIYFCMRGFIKCKIKYKFLLIPLFVVLLFIFEYFEFYIPYVGNLDKITNIDTYIQASNNRLLGNASYPEFFKTDNWIQYLIYLPLRVLYFIGSPFIWDIKDTKHIVGYIDSIFYFYLFFSFFRHYSSIMNNQALRGILYSIIPILMAFSIATSNFGGAIRHRSTMIVFFIIIIAPFLKKIRIN
jgi:hypothetical protein